MQEANSNPDRRLFRQRFARLPPLSIDRRGLNQWPPAESGINESAAAPPSPPTLCSRIADHLYVGSRAAAQDKSALDTYGITHVLDCVGYNSCAEQYLDWDRDLVRRTLWLRDNPSEDISSLFYDVFDYLEDVRRRGGRVLVHCGQGISRSPSFAVAYLIWRSGGRLSFDSALAQVKSTRRVANPNLGFACQLLEYQDRIRPPTLTSTSAAFCATTIAPHIYRLAPHSAYDPLHLVPKHIHNGSISALDSRGAFVIQAPCAIYVWIGQACPPGMADSARNAAEQICRYEKAAGPIRICRQNKEPVDFRDAFLLNQSGAGEKTVEAYNLDFELFKTASLGGILPPSSLPHSHPIRVPVKESKWSPIRPKLPRVPSQCLHTSAMAAASGGGNISVISSSLSSSPTSVLSPVLCKSPPEREPKPLNGAESSDITPENRSGAEHKLGLVQLYRLPTLEKLEYYIDSVDVILLRSEGAFLLVAFDSMNAEKKQKRSIYVWLGIGWMAKNREDAKKQDKDWKYVGRKIATECMPSIKECPIKVLLEGQEADDFWEHLAKR